MSDNQPGGHAIGFTKKYVSILLCFCIVYLLFIKRFYIQEVVCHSMPGAKTRVTCNKLITTFNFLIAIIMCCVMYFIVAHTLAHIVFNTPLRSVFKKMGTTNTCQYALMACVTYFVYHAVLAFLYWTKYDTYLIQHFGWQQSTTAYSVLVSFTVFVVLFTLFLLV